MAEPLAYVFVPYRMVPSRRLLCVGQDRLKVGGRAFDLLLALIERRDRTVSKQELISIVWPGLVVEDNNLQVQVAALRKLIGLTAIATIPGRGYRFTLAVAIEGDGVSTPPDQVDATKEIANPRSNLPHWLPWLIGRDDALLSVLDLMNQYAWVTITGPAGVGKTRLAQCVARRRLPSTPGGVWWVDLASLADPALVPSAVALAMGARIEANADVTKSIALAISDQYTLLVFDNAEHLLDGVAELLARLRPAASGLRLLLTSQEAIHAADEHVFRLEPLSLPDSATIDAAARSGAVALFVARAQANDRKFQIDENNVSAVSEICQRLDGIPLAIELAAARVAYLGVNGLRTRLDQRFEILTAGDRTVLRRHRTLREALEWTYHLLVAEEKAVFRRIGVFAGSFSLEAAQDVAVDEHGVDSWGVLEHLGGLIDKSLVVTEGDSNPRYRLLETLRLYALERLIEHDEAGATRSAHCDHYLRVAESASALMRQSITAGLRALDTDRDNLFLAMAWAHTSDDGNIGLRLAAATRLYWTSRGLVAKGLEFIESALAHPGLRDSTSMRGQVEIRASRFCGLLARHEGAAAHAIRAVAIARDLGDEDLLIYALAELGIAHLGNNNLTEAARFSDEGLALARRSSRDDALLFALTSMSAVHMRCGRFALARELDEEAMSISQRSGNRRDQVVGHLNLASCAIELNAIPEAQKHLAAARGHLTEVDSLYFGTALIRVAASWAAASGQDESALMLFAAHAAQCLRMGFGTKIEQFESVRLQAVRKRLAEVCVARAEKTALAWRYEDALAHANDLLQIAGAQ